jgi:prepilin-type N-terminal cleavage/methylation domain-containing protein
MEKIMQLRKQNGFTLVEIAIVLVIVGLLIGGVLKGQEMITNAKLKRLESDNAGVAAAMFSYQDRYVQLPGDDAGATARFTVYSSADQADGDGDGTIEGVWNQDTTATWVNGTQETVKFFSHLRAAGLVPGAGEDKTRPTNAYGGQIGIQDGSLGISGHVTIFGGIDGPVAKIIDGRLDDGKSASGRIQSAQLDSGGDMAAAGTAATDYLDDERYNMAFRL